MNKFKIVSEFEEDVPLITISKINSFAISEMKSQMTKILKNSDKHDVGDSKFCRNLRCKCIVADAELKSNLGNRDLEEEIETRKQMEGDVSNVCITILRFLMLDTQSMDKNLDLLYREAIKYLDKRRSSDEIMVEVLYPLYQQLLDSRYRDLKSKKDFNDQFTYDQRFLDKDSYMYWTHDTNSDVCDVDPICTNALDALVHTWQKLINVLNFNWEMKFGEAILTHSSLKTIPFFSYKERLLFGQLRVLWELLLQK